MNDQFDLDSYYDFIMASSIDAAIDASEEEIYDVFYDFSYAKDINGK